MESEPLESCPVCGGPVDVGWETESQGQAVECSTDLSPWHYKVAGSDYADAVAQHNTLARRAEIGRLVEKSCGGTLDGPLKIFPNTVGQWTVSLQSYSQGVLRVSGDTLLDALRALEREVSNTCVRWRLRSEVGGRDEPEGGPAL